MLVIRIANYSHNLIRRRRIMVLGIAIAIVALSAVSAIYLATVSAAPPAAADAHLRSLVAQLDVEQLTVGRHRAMQALEQAGPAAVAPLEDALHSQDATLRRNSAEMLGFIASPSALNALAGALSSDPAPAVRARAAWSLGELNDARAVGPLERAAVIDPSPQVRQEAVASLDALRLRWAVAAGRNPELVSAVAAAPGEPVTIYLAEFSHLSISRDGGLTWQALTANLPSRVTVLTVSPANSSVVYAGTESMGVFKSTDAGTTWEAMNEGLGVEPGVRLAVTALTIDSQNPDHVYAACAVWLGTSAAQLTPVGISATVDSGADWRSVSSPSTRLAITRLVFENHKLYASTPDQVIDASGTPTAPVFTS